MPQLAHSTLALLGMGAFALETARPQTPFVHSAWHCMSALSAAMLNPLLADIEQQQEMQQHKQQLPQAPMQRLHSASPRHIVVEPLQLRS